MLKQKFIMGLYFSLVILFVLGVAVYSVVDSLPSDSMADFLSSCMLCVSVLSLIAILGMSWSILVRKPDFDAIMNEYASVKENMELYDGGEYGNMVPLVEKAIDINETIARHKAFAGNWFVGVLYSEEVGSLEPIKFARQENNLD